MVYVEKILMDHIRLFGESKNEVKMGFLWKCAKNNKKIVCVLLSYLSVWIRFKVIYFILSVLEEGWSAPDDGRTVYQEKDKLDLDVDGV